jgi:Cd2+/Zn2+-exporting ATPase
MIYLAEEGELIGGFLLEDQIKENANVALNNLKKLGVKNTAILSGDNKTSTEKILTKLCVDTAIGELLPKDKAEIIENAKEKYKVMYVGDGINDGISIATADVGVAFGTLKTDVAISTADVVVLGDDINEIPKTIKHAKKIRNNIILNLILAIGVKFLVVLLGIFINVPMGLAIFADVGVLIIVILNCLSLNLLK